MFSKKPDPNQPKPQPTAPETPTARPLGGPQTAPGTASAPAAPKVKPAVSSISTDLYIKGNLKTTGDIQVQGKVDGDIRAQLLTIGESAKVKGEIVADDIVVQGHVIGCVRGLKVRLTATARVEGDIIHKTIAIESGAHFEGSVTRQDDPLNPSSKGAASTATASVKS